MPSSAPGYDSHDLEPIIGLDLTFREFGRGNRSAIMLDDNAARKEFLREEEFL
ncbi:MAG TPA: hypothetical protein VL361_28335 [Candidatus Limnocylindrales bacterium]|jgi:hypothetical protein|nr:hypothetical protein [Candidatus Limnocylindrales bacterium]